MAQTDDSLTRSTRPGGRRGRRTVFVAGGTGYIGGYLLPSLIDAGYAVRALARPQSINKVPAGCEVVPGNALEATTYQDRVAPAAAFVHLVGVSHPNPRKAEAFRQIDLASVKAAVAAACHARTGHFIYVSVAQPAPVMQAYVATRAACESVIRDSGLNATILRPWYVLGPGHWWPLVLLPFYKLFSALPATAETSARLGLLSLPQMRSALMYAVENPAAGIRILDVPAIRVIAASNRPSGRQHIPPHEV